MSGDEKVTIMEAAGEIGPLDAAPPPIVRSTRSGSFVFGGLVVAAVIAVVAVLSQQEPLAAGGAALILMVVLMGLRLPVALAMGISGALAIWTIAGADVLTDSLGSRPLATVNSWSLSVLPMFALMSFLLANSGTTTGIYTAAKHWFGWAPGGLALTTNFAGAGFSAISGSSVGIIYALGRISLPEMLRAGYDKRLATGTILMSGTMGNLIPPSILLVVYAGLAEVPVGDQLLAGIVPGALLALLYGAVIVIQVLARPSLVQPAGDQVTVSTWKVRIDALVRVIPVLLLIAAVVGGLYLGVFTATEAGAVGAFGALVLAAFYSRGRFLAVVKLSLVQTVVSTAAIFLLLVGAQIFNRMLTLSGLARSVTDLVVDGSANRVLFLVALAVLFLLLGTFMESTSMILITVPLFLPAIATLGIDPIWFGVFVVLLAELGMVTPPLGLLVFAMHSIAKDPAANLGQTIGIGTVYKSALSFLPAPLTLVTLLIAFPALTGALS